MSNIIPEKGINYSVYLNGEDLVGTAEGEFPNLEALTETVKGGGIAGEFESVVLGHFKSMALGLTWRNVTDAFVRLAGQRAYDLDLYLAQQDYNAGLGEYLARSVHVFVKAIPKNANIGNLVVGEKTNTRTDLEVLYLKLSIDGRERIELDKLNYIFRVDGVDYLAGVRRALGKE